jgi:hypothetical protein
MDQVHALIAELQAELQRQRDEIVILKAKSSRKHSLPDPEKLTGQFKYDTWLPSIKAKLRVDGEAIGDPIAQFYYVYLNLDSNVQAMVLPQLSQAETADLWDYNTILNQLSRVYDNPNKVQEAEDKLLSVKQQSTDSLHNYVAKYERLLYEANAQDWPDVTKISTFRNGLASTIRNRLSQQLQLPRTYPDFVKVVQQLAGRSTGSFHPSNTVSNEHSSAAKPSYGHHSHSEPMDITSINTIQPLYNAANVHVADLVESPVRESPLHKAMDICAATIARSISPARRDQLRKEGKCVRCGSQDHWVADCSLAPYSDRRLFDPTASAGTSGKKVTIAAAYDDDDSESLILMDIEELKATEPTEEAYERLRASATARRG